MRWLGKTVNLFWQLAALLCVLVALLVTLGREFSPRIESVSHIIEDRLTEATGFTHHITGLSAQWQGLSPRVVFDSVEIYRDDSKHAVKLEGGRAQLNIMRSVKEQALVFDELSVQGFTLGLGEHVEGGWGLIGSDPSTKETNISPIIDSLVAITEFRAGNGSLVLYPQQGDAIELQLNEVALLSDGFYRSIDIELKTMMSETAIRISGASEGDPRDPNKFVARISLDAQEQKHRRKQIWSLISDHYSDESNSSVENSIVEYSSNAWITFDPKNKLQWVAKFQSDAVPLPKEIDGVVIENLDFTVAGRSTQIDFHSINVPHIAADINGRRLELESTWFQLQGEQNQRSLDVGVASVELSKLSPLIHLLSDTKALEWVEGLQPKGQLHQLNATIPLTKGRLDELQVKANLSDVSVQAYKSSPGLSGVSGYIEATGLTGYLELSEAPIVQSYPNLFTQPIASDSMTGVVQWRVDLDDRRFYVGAEKISIKDKQFQGEGSFIVDAPLNPIHEDAYSPYLGLAIALYNVDVDAVSRFETVKGSSALKHWINDGFVDGQIKSAYLSIHGDSHREKPLHRKLLISGEIQDADLNYHADWPHLSNASGTVLIDDTMIEGDITSATFKGAEIRGAQLHTLASDRERTSQRKIQITGDVTADVDQLFTILRDTPLSNTFATPIEGWDGQGKVSGEIELTINATKGITRPPIVRIDTALDLEQLNMPNQKLSFTKLSGNLKYDNGTILSSPLKGLLFDKPFNARLSNHNNVANSLKIDFDGKVEMAKVSEIIDQTWMEFVTGDSSIRGELVFDQKNQLSQLRVESDLLGTRVRLPSPLGKESSQVTPFELKYDIGNKDIYVSSAQLNGFLPGSNIGYAEASFSVGDTTLPLISRGKYRVNLHTKSFDAGAWYQLYEEYSELLKNEQSRDSTKLAPLWVVEGGTDNLKLEDVEYGPVGVSARVTENNSWASLEHHQFGGIVELVKDKNPRIDLKFLNTDLFKNISDQQRALEESSELTNDQTEDTTSLIKIPDMSVHIGALTHDHEDSGEYWFELKNNGETLRFEDFKYKDSIVNGLETTQPGLVEWRYLGEQRTHVELALETSNISAVLEKNDLPALIKAAVGSLNVNLSWPGGINDFDRTLLQGHIKGRFEEGVFDSSSSSQDVLALFNILNFAYWADRAKIANEDASNRSVGFTSTQGTLHFDSGVMTTEDNIVVDSTGAEFELGGTFDLIQETVEGKLIVTLPVGENVAWITALAAGLPAAAGVFVVSKLFKKQLAPLQSVTYSLGGTFDSPTMNFESLFKVEQKKN